MKCFERIPTQKPFQANQYILNSHDSEIYRRKKTKIGNKQWKWCQPLEYNEWGAIITIEIKFNKFVCAANKSVIYEVWQHDWQTLNTGAVWNRLGDVIRTNHRHSIAIISFSHPIDRSGIFRFLVVSAFVLCVCVRKRNWVLPNKSVVEWYFQFQ